MTASASTSPVVACLQLGDVEVTNPNDYTQIFVVKKSTDEITSLKKDVPPSSLDQLDVIVNGSEFQTIYNPMELATWVPLLSASSIINIQVRGEENNGKLDLQPIHTSFLLAGLTCSSERREVDGSRILTAARKTLVPVNAAPLKKNNKNAAIAVNLDFDFDGGDNDDQNNIIDEDGLLEENNNLLGLPPAMTAQSKGNKDDDDCAGRKPCDNCTCGRAEREASGGETDFSQSQQHTKPSSSACGKCNLGDAFRCASCPFLGKPAFKAGEEHIILQMTDDL